MDKVEISSKAKEYNQLKGVVSKVIEDVNRTESPERLQMLKKEIAIGKYRIASEDIAEAIINTGFRKNI
jgi:anti-sigma28 factor (negative regulator of flagellin synthesis)